MSALANGNDGAAALPAVELLAQDRPVELTAAGQQHQQGVTDESDAVSAETWQASM